MARRVAGLRVGAQLRWDFGAFAALGAAIVSLGIAIAAMRGHPRH